MKRFTWLLIFGVTSAFGQTMTQADAFTAGKTAGSTTNLQELVSGINKGKAQEVMKGYTEKAPQSNYWGGDQTVLGTLQSGGADKVNECGTGTNVTGTENKQHCAAVNILANQYKYRPDEVIPKGDPLLTTGRGVTSNPDAIAGSLGGGLTNCTVKTVTGASTFSNETCDEFSETKRLSCSVGQQVVVDPDYTYQCNETIKTVSTSTCTYGEVVKVDIDYNYQCTRSPYNTRKQDCYRKKNVTVEQTCNTLIVTKTASGAFDTGMLMPSGSAAPAYAVSTICSSAYPGSTPQSGIVSLCWAGGASGTFVTFKCDFTAYCGVSEQKCSYSYKVTTDNGCSVLEGRS